MTEIWECEFDKLKEENESLKNYYNERVKHYSQIKKYGNINIRDSFYGGRTNNLKFSYECKEDEVLKYYDFTSLYPHVLVENDYPIGHPKVISENFKNINEYFGFIKCKILPPKQLYIPVLPLKINNKLTFPLCTACAAVQNTESCDHTDEERTLCGTWTTMEIQKAVKCNYEIKTILEVIHYDDKRDDIFQPYIQTWLKIKTQASDWPQNCTTAETKNEFIQKFRDKEGII